MLYSDLRLHRTLAERRNPAFDQNRFAKHFMRFGEAFMLAYALFIGVMLKFMFEGIFPHMEPYHIFNKGWLYFFAFDFLLRFAFQKIPAQEMKPYMLLPIGKKRLLNTYLLLSATQGYNLAWMALFAPFALLTVTRFYGLTGVLLYLVGMWLLTLANNYWYLLCRILLNERTLFLALPLGFYAALAAVEFGCGHPLSTLTMDWGEAFILGRPWAFAATVALVLAVAWTVRIVQARLIYSEQARTADTKVRRVSEYRFLERYGEVGEYLRLELKLIFRNKNCRRSFRTGLVAVALFSLLVNIEIDGETMYAGPLGQSFVLAYCYAVLALTLTQIMSFEGNYLDGLMSRKESLYSLLRAKYCYYCLVALVPFVLLLPAVFMGHITLLASTAYLMLAVGPVYAMMFQLAVYNKQTASLNESLTGKNRGGTFFQTLITLAAFFLPMLLSSLLTALVGTEATWWTFIGLGLAVVATSPLWIRNVYVRFMRRRYENMEGFRSTR